MTIPRTYRSSRPTVGPPRELEKAACLSVNRTKPWTPYEASGDGEQGVAISRPNIAISFA